MCSYENDKDDFLACEMCGTERPSAAGHGSIEEETIAQREVLATAASLQLATKLEEKEREEQEARDRQVEADEVMATKEHNSMNEEVVAEKNATTTQLFFLEGKISRTKALYIYSQSY